MVYQGFCHDAATGVSRADDQNFLHLSFLGQSRLESQKPGFVGRSQALSLAFKYAMAKLHHDCPRGEAGYGQAGYDFALMEDSQYENDFEIEK